MLNDRVHTSAYLLTRVDSSPVTTSISASAHELLQCSSYHFLSGKMWYFLNDSLLFKKYIYLNQVKRIIETNVKVTHYSALIL